MLLKVEDGDRTHYFPINEVDVSVVGVDSEKRPVAQLSDLIPFGVGDE